MYVIYNETTRELKFRYISILRNLLRTKVLCLLRTKALFKGFMSVDL